MKNILFVLILTTICLSKAQKLGDLDTTFGNNGVTEYYISNGTTPSNWKGFLGNGMYALNDNRFFYTGTTE